MHVFRPLVSLLAILALAGCASREEADQNEGRDALAQADLPATGEPMPDSTGGPAIAAADSPSGPCMRVDSDEARSFTRLELMGTVGDARFFGRARELLCSEAGAGGRGECELPKATVVRVEAPDEVYGFRSDGSAPAILTYSPEGFTCAARRAPG